jgi:catechol 2,3-dioxygenase-like lactoylglutathione lyase family enzyme
MNDTYRWYTRPVFFVADIQRARSFYTGQLGFEVAWHEGDGTGTVCQVNRAGCEIILCQDAARAGKGRIFVELTAEALRALRSELAERAVPSRDSWWGSDVVQVDDPEGNEIFFPVTT